MGIGARCGKEIGIHQTLCSLAGDTHAIASPARYDTLGVGAISHWRFRLIESLWSPLAPRGHGRHAARDFSKPAARAGKPAHQ
jgi:hypothetical protein